MEDPVFQNNAPQRAAARLTVKKGASKIPSKSIISHPNR